MNQLIDGQFDGEFYHHRKWRNGLSQGIPGVMMMAVIAIRAIFLLWSARDEAGIAGTRLWSGARHEIEAQVHRSGQGGLGVAPCVGAVVRDTVGALFVAVESAALALEPLPHQPEEHHTAVVAKGGRFVRVNIKCVRSDIHGILRGGWVAG